MRYEDIFCYLSFLCRVHQIRTWSDDIWTGSAMYDGSQYYSHAGMEAEIVYGRHNGRNNYSR